MDRKNRQQTRRRSGAVVLAAGLTLTFFGGAGTASADELAPTDETRTLADAGGVPNGGNGNGNQGNEGNQGNQGGGQENGNANAGGGNPNGNNGTVKVHGSEGDESTRNEPKVDCLNLAWYDYADAATANVVVTMVGGPDSAEVGTASTTLVPDPADGGGYDGELAVPLDFTGIDPAQNGMYHVRIDVTTSSSNGSDTKSKVVWVAGGCGGTDPGGNGPCTENCDSGGFFDLDPVVTTEAAPAPVEDPTEILGVQVVDNAPAVAAAPAAESQVQGAELARTGALTDRLIQIAGLCLVLGGLAMAATRERIAVPAHRR